MLKTLNFPIFVYVLVILTWPAQAETLSFECGFPENLGFGAGNNAVCYGDPAHQQNHLSLGNHCSVKSPILTERILSFRMAVDTETQQGIATFILRHNRMMIELSEEEYEQEKTEEAKKSLEWFKKGTENTIQVISYKKIKHLNFIDPVTGESRNDLKGSEQVGHLLLLEEAISMFIDEETKSAILTNYGMWGKSYWSVTTFGSCRLK